MVIGVSIVVVAMTIFAFLNGLGSESLASPSGDIEYRRTSNVDSDVDGSTANSNSLKDSSFNKTQTDDSKVLQISTTVKGQSQTKNENATQSNIGSNPIAGYPSGILLRKIDVGPGTSSLGHTPVTTFKTWPGSVVKEGIIPRDSDGWLRINGYEFSGATKIETGNVKISNSRFLPGNQSGTITNGKCSYYPAMVFSSSKPPAGELVLEHISIDQGPTGWTLGGIGVYMKTTLRYSHIKGPNNSITAMSNSLYEHNYLEGNSAGTQCSQGSYNGIKGNYQKVNWTARHNTIISAVGVTTPVNNWGSACIHNDVMAPRTPFVSYGILVENNYCNGFRRGIYLNGTDPNNKNIVRNNFFGTDFTDSGSRRIHMSTEFPHTIVENNNVVNMDFVESVGSVRRATVGLLPAL